MSAPVAPAVDTVDETAPVPRTPSAPWSLSNDDLVRALEVSSTQGLSAADAADRLAAHGRNELAETPPPRPIVLFIDQFRNPLVLILVAGAVVSAVAVTPEMPDALMAAALA